MSLKTFLMKKMIKSKMKGVPDEQVDKILEVIDKNPDFFKKIASEIEHETKSGKNQQAATMAVMRKYQGDIQKMMQG